MRRLKKPPTPAAYRFCEPVHATPTSRVHIRLLGSGEQPRLGGGITGRPLCGYDLRSGWDLPGEVDPGRVERGLYAVMGPTCLQCAHQWAEATGVTL